MRRVYFVSTLACLALLIASSPAFPAERGGVKLVNAMEIDRWGNTFEETTLINNGRPLGIGEPLEPGLVQNTGSRPAILTLSNGKALKLDAGEIVMLTATTDPIPKCICYCGSDIFAFGDTTQSACVAHNGQRCLQSNGHLSTLSDCGLTWVPPADPAQSPEPDPAL